MFYSYVKQAKVGELAEGENPMHTIRIGAESEAELFEKKAMYVEQGWQHAEESEWEGTDESAVEAVEATEEAIGNEVVAEMSEPTPEFNAALDALAEKGDIPAVEEVKEAE